MDPVVASWLARNSSNASELCASESLPVSITVVLCLVFLAGFILNTFSIWVFCCRLSCWTSGTTLQFHLALSDAVATALIPMMAVHVAMRDDWHFRQFLCQAKLTLLNLHFYGSTIFLTLISVHRYMAVVHFKRNSCMKSKKFVQKLCAGIWILIIFQSLLIAFILSKQDENSLECVSFYQRNLTNRYFSINFVLFTVGFLLPLLVSVFCYSRLAISLKHLNISTAKGLRVKEKSRHMIGLCLLIFGLCFLPMNVVRTIFVVLMKYYPQKCSALQQMETAYYTTWIFAGLNGCLDPLLYCFGCQSFREAFRSFRIAQRESPKRSDSDMTASHDNQLR
ncbi:P2Y purinoceptor 2 [Salarias fasciatus]|uniref:P2Y purinoceptor 2-like n=1 Tax=Salarias fasciatus TaxID=181472 RepID=A0A672GTF8_SALFA|nr:P2Y purinoceptor 2-like [Salarias fasciatus]